MKEAFLSKATSTSLCAFAMGIVEGTRSGGGFRRDDLYAAIVFAAIFFVIGGVAGLLLAYRDQRRQRATPTLPVPKSAVQPPQIS